MQLLKRNIRRGICKFISVVLEEHTDALAMMHSSDRLVTSAMTLETYKSPYLCKHVPNIQDCELRASLLVRFLGNAVGHDDFV